ncbi:reverse transcriptase domain-containing protein, partial [Tanacetum coccineum]
LRGTQMDLVGFAGGVVKPLGKIELEVVFGDGDGLKIPLSGFLDNTLRGKVPHPKGDRDLGHSVRYHFRVSEVRKEANGRTGGQSEYQLRKRSLEKSGFDRTDIGQPSIPRSAEPIAQKRRVLASDRTQVVSKEVEEWVNARIVHPVRYPTWISKPMLVKKSDGSWRMCIDFKNINSACPKDYYPLSNIDEKIESVANPKKTKAIADMQSPQTLKEMHSLSRKLAALKRFLSRSAEKSLPFFKTLKDITNENKDEDRWSESTEKAFQEMKKVIVELLLLNTPVKEETLYVNVAATMKAISVVLLAERKRKQCLIHYVSRTLNEAERNYASLEKLALKLDKYSVELGAYNIAYEPRNVMKGQLLADFLSEALVGTPTEEFFRLPAKLPNKDDVERWTLFTDGASNGKGSRAGLVLISPSSVEFTPFTGQLRHQGDPHGNLRNAHRSEVRGGESYKTMILLADYA